MENYSFLSKTGSWKKGSAYLLAVTIVALLVIGVMVFSSSKTARRWTTRLLSDESKAEALANSAAELALREIKDKMNDNADDTLYTHFRLPAKVKAGLLTTNSLGTSSGQDAELDLSDLGTWGSLELDQSSGVLQSLDSIITNMGGRTTHVDLTLKAGIVYAGAISSKNPSYPVVGVSVKAKTPHADEARFLGLIDSLSALGIYSLQSHLIGDYYVDFTLPNQTQPPPPGTAPLTGADSHDFSVSIPILPDLSGTVTLEKTGIGLIKYDVEVEGVSVKDGTFNCNDFFNDYIGTTGTRISLVEFLKICAKYPTTNPTISWVATKFFAAAKNRYQIDSDVTKNKDVAAALGDLFSPPVVVEKSGILRIEADVTYRPQGVEGKKTIRRRLFAEREIKVSDVQPPAPEYALFIANSKKICEAPDPILSPPEKLADPIDLLSGVATFAVHCIPRDTGNPLLAGFDELTGFIGLSGNSNISLPGMIRINSTAKMELNTFLGTLDEPTSSELNALFSEKIDSSKAKMGIVSFQWRDRSPDRPFNFALVKNSPVTPPTVVGLENLASLLSFCDVLSAPTLLNGNGQFEQPLSLKTEAYLDKRYSTLNIKVLPKASTGGDETEIDVNYTINNDAYGLPGLPAYNSGADWSPNDVSCMPANLYSALQYAKKANFFYESEADFWSHGERFPGGCYDAQGVTYIKGNLTINSSNLATAGLAGEFKVKGQGILVAKEVIELSQNVSRQSADTVFSLIARLGYLDIQLGCNKIEACCYSNLSLVNVPGNSLTIDGNLVTNQFKRDLADSVHIQYNGRASRITTLSVMRDVGKLDPKRYHVSLGKRWSRFEFQKQK